MPHDAWRVHLPFMIDTYKNLNPAVEIESMVAWFRRSPARACQDGGTTGNTASQLQYEYDPSEIFQDRIFVAALLDEKDGGAPAVRITTDSDKGYSITWYIWDHTASDKVGIWQTSIPFHDTFIDNGELKIELVHLHLSDASPALITIQTDAPPPQQHLLSWADQLESDNSCRILP